MTQTAFPQADRDAVTAFVDCLFRYADENAWINLRAFHDLKDGAPPLFVEPIRIGATDFIERVCERIHEAAAILSRTCFARLSAPSRSRTVRRPRTWPRALLSASNATAILMQPSRSSQGS